MYGANYLSTSDIVLSPQKAVPHHIYGRAEEHRHGKEILRTNLYSYGT
jgi:hypothetical protein